MKLICSDDGVWIHPEVGTISASSRDEAMREVERRKAVKREKRA